MTFQAKFAVSSLLTIVLTVAMPILALGQTGQNKPAVDAAQKEKEAELKKEFDKKTLALLNDVAAGAWSLKLPENRVFIMANAAGLLWKSDEKRARTLYWDALNAINLMAAPPARANGEKLSTEEQSEVVRGYTVIVDLRQNLLRQVARNDPQLALDMLRASRPVPPKQLAPDHPFRGDIQLEQEIAGEIAARDPAQALQLARQSLAKGITLETLNLLQKLNDKDSEKASQFASELIAKLKTTNIVTDFRASVTAVQLLHITREPGAARASLSLGADSAGPKRLKLDNEQKREIVELLVNAALSTSGGRNLLSMISELMPEIEEFAPERRAAIERKLAALNETLSKAEQDRNALHQLLRKGTPEEIVRAANAADNDTRISLYMHAAIEAVRRGTTDSFRDLISKEIKSDSERARILDVVVSQEIAMAAARKDIDKLQELLPKIRGKAERVRIMVGLALMLKENGEDETAIAMLDEAATLVKADLKDEKQTEALLSLMFAYAVVDPPKAFALAERTIDHANNQISLLLLLDKLVKSGGVKKNEIILDQGRIMPLDFLAFQYGKGVAALAKVDFNRTRALAERFDRTELRLMAQLLILKGILQPNPPSVIRMTRM